MCRNPSRHQRHEPCSQCGGCRDERAPSGLCHPCWLQSRRVDPARCAYCEDIATVLQSTSDPHLAAERLGRSVEAVSKHAYRHGRVAWARLFHAAHERARRAA